MRISIEIDITESEIDLATELLSTLRCATVGNSERSVCAMDPLTRHDDPEARPHCKGTLITHTV